MISGQGLKMGLEEDLVLLTDAILSAERLELLHTSGYHEGEA